MKPAVISHFKQHDPLLLSVYEQLDSAQQPIDVTPQPESAFFSNLCESIIGQQLSNKAADTIWRRLIGLFPQHQITPQSILETDDENLRAVGISRAKAVYLKALAQAVVDEQLNLPHLSSMSNAEVITALTWIKGIGQWTAEMFMMFTLGREDVFSMGDLGLKNGLHRWYSTPDRPLTKDEMMAITAKWAPYRTYAAKILWRSLELPTHRT